MVRTKSGRVLEKTISINKEENEEMQRIAREGGDPTSVLRKYMGKDEEIQSCKVDPPPKPMKESSENHGPHQEWQTGIVGVIKMTEEEYKAFQESGEDINFLKKFVGLNEGEDWEKAWEKASTVYAAHSDDEQVQKAEVDQRIVGEDGVV